MIRNPGLENSTETLSFEILTSTMALLQDPPEKSPLWPVTDVDRELLLDSLILADSERKPA